MKRFACCLVLALALLGCNSEEAGSGLGEPMRVTNGQFFPGAFPAEHMDGPAISQIVVHGGEFFAGATGRSLLGDSGAGSYSIALGLKGLGSGYWVVPVSAEDPITPGLFIWGANLDFSQQVPPGIQGVQIAASDANGNFGPITTQNLSVKSLIPKAHVVASLTWGDDADLDLHIISPSRKELDPKHPNTIASDENGMPVAGSGLLDRDSMAACLPDGTRTENVVWADAPEAGLYIVNVDMFSACKQPAATFKFTLYVDGVAVKEKAGRLLDIDADGGGPGSGLFVTEFSCDEGTGTCS